MILNKSRNAKQVQFLKLLQHTLLDIAPGYFAIQHFFFKYQNDQTDVNNRYKLYAHIFVMKRKKQSTKVLQSARAEQQMVKVWLWLLLWVAAPMPLIVKQSKSTVKTFSLLLCCFSNSAICFSVSTFSFHIPIPVQI